MLKTQMPIFQDPGYSRKPMVIMMIKIALVMTMITKTMITMTMVTSKSRSQVVSTVETSVLGPSRSDLGSNQVIFFYRNVVMLIIVVLIIEMI